MEKVAASQDYLNILKEYNNKGLCSQIASHFGLSAKGNTYQKTIIRMLKGDVRAKLIVELKKYLPELHSNDLCRKIQDPIAIE